MTSDVHRRSGGAAGDSPMPAEAEASGLPATEELAPSLDVSFVAPRRRLGFGTLVLAATACVSALSLYTMRIVGTAGADAGATEAGMLVESFLKERGGRTEQAGGRTDLLDPEASARLQVPADEVARNPFVLAHAGGGASFEASDPSMPEVEPVDPMAEATAVWNMNAEAGIAEIRLESVMVSSRRGQSIASINGRVMREGEMVSAPGVGMEYRLRAVEIGAVVLEARDEALATRRLFRIERTVGN